MSLESFVTGMGNVLLRSDALNEPSIFVRHPKQISSEFDALLPAHTHPAFIIGEDEDAARLIGKYANSSDSIAESLCSLPNRNPMPAVARSYSGMVEWAKNFGGTVSEMTIADHGLLVLIAHKNKWVSHGNNISSSSNASPAADYRTGTPWRTPQQVMEGDIRIWNGYAYVCIKSHITSMDIKPHNAPGYWKKLKKVGGTTIIIGSAQTLTGSGPIDWYFLNDSQNEADLNGNVPAWLTGVQLYEGEIQILPNNDAALAPASLSNTDSSWRAIKPHSGDNGYDLVSPGTDGTVHYAYVNNNLTLTARQLNNTEFSTDTRTSKFNQIVIDTSTMPIVPSILYELGLAPLPDTVVDGGVRVVLNQGVYWKALCGGHTTLGEIAGIGCLDFSYDPNTERNWLASRSSARELA